jgi:hypothetical protein
MADVIGRTMILASRRASPILAGRRASPPSLLRP